MGKSAVDMFYYIMDYSSHYYRLDANDQLVAADESEATVFSFVEANKRIGSGSKKKFYFMIPIESNDNEDEVENKEKNIEENENQNQNMKNDNNEGAAVSSVKELTEGELSETVEKSISEYDLSKVDWEEYLRHFTYVVAGLKDYRESLVKAESDIDQKICDILHYIELCDMDESESAELVELIKVCREKRRDIKDEIFRVDMFQRNIGTSANVAKVKDAIKSIKGLETRKYTPRKFLDLFEGSQVDIITRKNKSVEACENSSMNNKNKSVKEEPAMSYERRDTIYDNKKNDWMAFAIEQAEFYKNARQHIINLKIDIKDIDNAIADLMDEIETSNCNVTQGYKLFKKLKELRLERKDKEKELECLYILTERFDIGAMSEACDDNVYTLEKFLYGNKDDNEESTNVSESVDESEDDNCNNTDVAV